MLNGQESPIESRCPICNGLTTKIISNEIRRGEGEVGYCENCEHGFLSKHPISDLKAYYGEGYREEYSHNAEPAPISPQELHSVYKNYQVDRLQKILPFLNDNSNFLEIGASAGQFISHIINRVNTVSAVELDQACCQFLKSKFGIEVESEYLEDSRFFKEKYDVVCSFQVIEHTEDPVKFLKSIKSVTHEKSVIFIEAPNLHDPLISIWGVPAYQKFYYHNAHLHYFTEASLKKIALESGFNINQIEVGYTQDYNILNHLHWIMNNSPQSDCHVGLSKINIQGLDSEITSWINLEMRALNERYIQMLINKKSTSNLLMKITC